MPRRASRVLEHVVPWLPLFLALSVNSPLARGQTDRPALEPRRDPRPAAPARSAARASNRGADWELLVRRFVRRRPRRQLHARSTGTSDRIRRSARSRCGCRTSRRTSRVPAAFIDARPGARRVGARAAPAARVDPVTAPSTMQNRWAASRFGPRADLHPSRTRAERGRARAISIASSWSRIHAPTRSTGRRARPRLQLAFADPHEATADVVRRSLA